MARVLERAVLRLDGGLVTKLSPEVSAGLGLAVSQNVDGFDFFRGLGKLPGSSRQSDASGAPWDSLHYYEYFDVRRLKQRQALGSSGGTFYRIETSKALTTLRTPIRTGYLRSATQFDRIHLIGSGNVPFKFDGFKTTDWGMRAPGQYERVIDALNSASGFAANGTNAVATQAAVSIDLDGSVEVTKLDTTTTECSITKTGLALDFGGGSTTAQIWVNVPQGGLSVLPKSGTAIEIRLGTGANNNLYRFERGDLFGEGWNLLTFVLASPDATTGLGATLTAVTEYKLTFFSELAPFTIFGWLWDKLFITDSGQLSATTAGAGDVTGTVTYRIVYVSEYGQRSNAGPTSTPLVCSNNAVALSGIAPSPDAQCIAREIYRDNNGDSVWRLVGRIDDNSTMTFTDNVAEVARALDTPPLAGSEDDDASIPPMLSDVALIEGHMMGISAERPFELAVSVPFGPEQWPLIQTFQFEKELQAIRPHARGGVLYADKAQYLIDGDSIDNFTFREIHPEVGACGPRAVETVGNQDVGWHNDGAYLHTGFNPWYITSTIRDLADFLPTNLLRDLHAIHDRRRFRIVFFAKFIANLYNLVLSYGYGYTAGGALSETGAGIDALDPRRGQWTLLGLPVQYDPRCSCIIERTEKLLELWIGCADGFVYRLQDPSAFNWAVGEGQEAMQVVFEPCPAPMGDGKTFDNGLPLFVDFIVFGGALPETWTMTVKTLSAPLSVTAGAQIGNVISQVTREVTFQPGWSNPTFTIPSGLEKGSFVTVRLENAALNAVARFGSTIGVRYAAQPFEGESDA